MNELKITISRSYSRKLNMGNYESQDYFANYSEEIDATTPKDKIAEVSALLYDMARGDVEKAIAVDKVNFGDVDPETRTQLEKTDWVLTALCEKVRKGETIMFSEWDKLSKPQQDFLHKQQLLHDAEMRANNKDVEKNRETK
jgi:hypothetical protein